MAKCHHETINGISVWIPGCMGGAVYGDKYHCTCTSTPRQNTKELPGTDKQHTEPAIADIIDVIESLAKRLSVEDQHWMLAKLGRLQQAGR